LVVASTCFMLRTQSSRRPVIMVPIPVDEAEARYEQRPGLAVRCDVGDELAEEGRCRGHGISFPYGGLGRSFIIIGGWVDRRVR
jgi:hypothetical protein